MGIISFLLVSEVKISNQWTAWHRAGPALHNMPSPIFVRPGIVVLILAL